MEIEIKSSLIRRATAKRLERVGGPSPACSRVASTAGVDTKLAPHQRPTRRDQMMAGVTEATAPMPPLLVLLVALLGAAAPRWRRAEPTTGICTELLTLSQPTELSKRVCMPHPPAHVRRGFGPTTSASTCLDTAGNGSRSRCIVFRSLCCSPRFATEGHDDSQELARLGQLARRQQ